MQKQKKINLSLSFSADVAQALFDLRENKQVNLSKFVDRLLFKALKLGGDGKNA